MWGPLYVIGVVRGRRGPLLLIIGADPAEDFHTMGFRVSRIRAIPSRNAGFSTGFRSRKQRIMLFPTKSQYATYLTLMFRNLRNDNMDNETGKEPENEIASAAI